MQNGFIPYTTPIIIIYHIPLGNFRVCTVCIIYTYYNAHLCNYGVIMHTCAPLFPTLVWTAMQIIAAIYESTTNVHVYMIIFLLSQPNMFYGDIYPPCFASIPALSADEWMAGANKKPVLISFRKDSVGSAVSQEISVSNS